MVAAMADNSVDKKAWNSVALMADLLADKMVRQLVASMEDDSVASTVDYSVDKKA